MQEKTQTEGFDVIHPNIAYANPSVVKQRKDGDKGQNLHPLGCKNTRPLFVANWAAGEADLHLVHSSERGHQSCCDALRQPVAKAVVSASRDALGTVIN